MYVRVRVTPGAKRERVVQRGDAEFEIAVKEPAARNLANKRVQELVAAHLSGAPRHVRLISGHRSSNKIFSIE